MNSFRLGYVEDPLPEHEQYKGCLVIPYLRWHPRHGWTCISLRFRNINGDKPKYLTIAGDRPRLYNTVALIVPSQVVGIAEGELDAISATLAGLPTVGVPGVQSWKPHWNSLFQGYETVKILADGDEAGHKFAKNLAKQLPNAVIINSPEHEDVNDILVKQGKEALRERICN